MILEVLEPLQWEGETGHLLRFQRETSCKNVLQVDYWIGSSSEFSMHAIGYWSGFSLKEFLLVFHLPKHRCAWLLFIALCTGYNLKSKNKKNI